jgi:hypothetical protein
MSGLARKRTFGLMLLWVETDPGVRLVATRYQVCGHLFESGTRIALSSDKLGYLQGFYVRSG